MNIKRAKQEVKNSIEAYLLKDEHGDYLIPSVHQRPVLLMGPPGIGKTQIMEQIAEECKIGLVAYTITHHTRQSAIGLPFIRTKEYGGKEYSVTEYTMSEIIASVYDKIEETGLKEGILFIDEINCVSETLAPTMLQFLQCKTFGNQKVPEGWIIVAAGNPPEYNKSVREFDVVTWDRIKRIDVEENFEVWKEYAYKAQVHPAIISYLDLKRDHFYKMENTVDGRLFATARGWEDLSRLIYAYERLGKKVDREVVHQYIQHTKIAKDFANYLELYRKYQKDYGLKSILDGKIEKETLEKLRYASFDERLSVVGMLVGKLSEQFKKAYEKDFFVEELYARMLKCKEIFENNDFVVVTEILAQESQKIQEENEKLKKNVGQQKQQFYRMEAVKNQLEEWTIRLAKRRASSSDQFEFLKGYFEEEVKKLDEVCDETLLMLNNAFYFMEQAFGESQEMVVFVTDLNTNFYSIAFLKDHDCEMYNKYNKGLLFEQRHQDLSAKLDAVENNVDVLSDRLVDN